MKIELYEAKQPETLGSLNPYSNGMKIELNLPQHWSGILNCLNPYSNGMKIERV